MRSINSKKRGQLGGLAFSIITLVVAIVILVMGLIIIQEVRDVNTIVNTGTDGCNATSSIGCEAYQAANDSLVGLATFADFIPIIVIAVAASIIIGLILIGFAFSGRGR